MQHHFLKTNSKADDNWLTNYHLLQDLLMKWSWNWGWHHVLIHIQCQCVFYLQYCNLPTLNKRCYIYDKAYRVVSNPISGIVALLTAWKLSRISLPRYGISVSGWYSDQSGFKIIIINLRESMHAKVLLFTGKALPTKRHSGQIWGETYCAVVQRLQLSHSESASHFKPRYIAFENHLDRTHFTYDKWVPHVEAPLTLFSKISLSPSMQ